MLQQQLPAIASAALRLQRRHRAEQPELLIRKRACLEQITQLLEKRRGVLVMVIFRADQNMAAVGRKRDAAALGERLIGKRVITLMQQRL